MANAIYPKYKEVILGAATNTNLLTGTVKVALVTSGYAYSTAHQFASSLSNKVGTDQTIGATKSVTDGVFDGADVTFTSVASGSTVNALVIYVDTGTAGTSPLVAYIDSGIGGTFPVTTNGGDITITWNASGIFAL